MSVEISQADSNFSDWPALLALLHRAFGFMDGRIAPPSSLHLLTRDSIADKSQAESLFLATKSGELLGCVFAAQQPDSLYIGKLAVHPEHQRKGIGRRLMDAVEHYAVSKDIDTLELNTRIELIENQSTFQSMGYHVTGEHSHEGFDRPTFISMRKTLSRQRS